MRRSWRDSLGMSTSAAVSAIGSARKSRGTVFEGSGGGRERSDWGMAQVATLTVTSASGVGIATIAADGTILDTWFPEPELLEDDDVTAGTTRLSVAEVPEELGALENRDEHRGVDVVVVRTSIASLDDKPVDAYDVYL